MNIFTEHTWWYLARASGIVAVALLVMSVSWGVALSTRVSSAIRPAWTLEVHKWLSGLAFWATALHLLGLYLDGYIDFGFAELFVPGASSYRPFAVAVGVLTSYAMLAVQITSWARKHISRRVWHGVHMLAYGVVWGALLHAGLAGTDATNRAYQLLAALMITVTAIAIGVRVFAPPSGARRRSEPRAAHPASVPPGPNHRLVQTRAPLTDPARPVRARWAPPTVTSGATPSDPRRHPDSQGSPTNGWVDPLIPIPARRATSNE